MRIIKNVTIQIICMGFLISFSHAATQVWACQSSDRSGLFWGGNSWTAVEFTTSNWLVRIEGDKGIIQLSGSQIVRNGVECSLGAEEQGLQHLISCHNLHTKFIIDTQSGSAGLADLFGAIKPGGEHRQHDAWVEVMQCTPFEL